MKTRTYWPAIWAGCLAVGLLMIRPGAAGAQTGERLSDNDVKQVIEALNQSRDRFEDQLDGDVKRSIVRGPNGEVSVERFLDDLQENVKHLKDRFSSQYAASKEAQTVLQQATSIANYFTTQKKVIRGQSEFDRMATDLRRLASAYGTTFPLPSLDAPVRRINDDETAATAEELVRKVDALKREIDREKTVPAPAKDSFKRDLDALKQTANTVKSRAGDSKPSLAEARQLMDMAGKISMSLKQHSGMAPATLSAVDALQAPLDKLKQAYSLR